MADIDKNCRICGTDVKTIADNPLCSTKCKRRWAEIALRFNPEKCPTCGKKCRNLSGTVGHHNQKHDFKIAKTEVCEQCGETFVPKNMSGPNKYCGEKCMGLAQRKWNPEKEMDCEECGETFTYNEGMYEQLDCDRRYCGRECWRVAQEAVEGGTSQYRFSKKGRAWKRVVKARFDECQECGKSEDETTLHAHHIIPISEDPTKAYNVGNGTVLCAECHADEHDDVPRELILANGGGHE